MSGGTFFERKIYQELLEWKENSSDSYALMIEGARRVGKTTVVKEFAKNEYRSSILIDFSFVSNEVKSLFEDHLWNLDTFFFRLQSIFNVRLYPRESLIIFDEVQLYPIARQAIKHLVADGRYSYIETGSLISIRKNVERILIPSEELSITMHPMDFEEFLWAQDKNMVVDLIRGSFESRTPLGFESHKSLMALYTMYMLIGGMPSVVDAYLSKNDPDEVEKAKRAILKLYRDDLMKVTGITGVNARKIFELIPSYLSRHDKSFSPSDVKSNSATRDYLDSVSWLEQSKIVNVCHKCSEPSPALDMSIDDNSFKMYLLDTGLLMTLALEKNISDRSDLYGAILDNKLSLNKGMFFENMVSQELVMSGKGLVFIKFYSEDSDRIQEVDFLIADGKKVTPIEVKSSRSSQHASLDRIVRKYPKSLNSPYVIHSKDLDVRDGVTYIPIYMTMLL